MLRKFLICAVRLDHLSDLITTRLPPPQGSSAQSIALTPSRASITLVEEAFQRLHVQFVYLASYLGVEGHRDFPEFDWSPFSTEDSAAELACQYLQHNYMPEQVTVLAVQSVPWMGHEWPEAKLTVRETSRVDFVMVYNRVVPELVADFIDSQQQCATFKQKIFQQGLELQQLVDLNEQDQARSSQARLAILCSVQCVVVIL